jgi:hypothetical protein
VGLHLYISGEAKRRRRQSGRLWMKMKHSGVQSDNNRFSRRVDKDIKMATEGRRYAGKKILELMVKRQCKLLRGWLRPAENLNRPEKRVQVCEPETGRNLSDAEDEMGSDEDLKHCQEGREETPNFQVGKVLRSLRDLTDYHEDNQGISHCQVGNGSRSLWDLIDCQEGSRQFPNI